jgi:hypothetical protein
MSAPSFGAAAARLAGVAARLLGWRPAEFWAATPAELASALMPAPEQVGAPLSRGELDALIARETGV